jgi:hypothetical protein
MRGQLAERFNCKVNDLGLLATFGETAVRFRAFRSGKVVFSSVAGSCRPATRWRITKSGQEPDLAAKLFFI